MQFSFCLPGDIYTYIYYNYIYKFLDYKIIHSWMVLQGEEGKKRCSYPLPHFPRDCNRQGWAILNQEFPQGPPVRSWISRS